MTQDDPKRPPPERVFAIVDQVTGGSEEKLRRLAEEFPNADGMYLAEILAERVKELTAIAEKAERGVKAGRAVRIYLRNTGYHSLAHACEDLGLEREELWAQVMEEAGLPDYEIPETIQVRWAH